MKKALKVIVDYKNSNLYVNIHAGWHGIRSIPVATPEELWEYCSNPQAYAPHRETTPEYLARGGTITKIVLKKPELTKTDMDNLFDELFGTPAEKTQA